MQNSRYFLILAAVLRISSAGDVWGGTEAPEDWPKSFPQCGGKKQSPIRIEPANAEVWTPTEQKKKNFEMKFEGYKRGGKINAYNTGYLANRTFEYSSEKPQITLTQNGETVEYFLTNIHFHWPSEHALSAPRAALESHVVHRNREMNRVIALAYLINVCSEAEEEKLSTEKDMNAAFHTLKSGSSYSYRATPEFLLPKDFECGYYMYEGSQTTPPCTEGVTWFVYRKTLCVDKIMLDIFTNMKNKNGKRILSNSRPFQDNDLKVVYLSCNEDGDKEK